MTTQSLAFLKPSATVGLAMLAVGLVMTAFESVLLIGRMFVLVGVIDLVAAFVFRRLRRGAS
ncbi:hypothetical protein MNBD_ACTINO02-2917 [hydrothermal vent metagenome]|uniref:Uncharacterized protein n=1 Tax=hydrothermal vent metagenome TaxID=652676 RepID=A0A3B0SJB1_9ZZZZ